MKRLLIAILAACAIPAAAPAVASAGCQATGGKPWYVSSEASIYDIATIYCTTNNGAHYQLRAYLQSNDGGWHILNGVAAQTRNYTNPPNNFYQDVQMGPWLCGSIASAATQVREKAIVENTDSGTKDTTYTEALTIPTSCHG